MEYCYRHPGVETGVHCTRCDRPICPKCMNVASVGFQCPECVKEGSKGVRQARTIYGGRAHGGQVDIITRTLIGLNVAVFLITLASGAKIGGGEGGSKIYAHFALVPVAVAHGQWYRLFTSEFLHYGFLHIAFNMYALYLVGPALEASMGRLRFITLYVLSGVGGGVLSMAFGPSLEQAAGASGAIFGLFGAFYAIERIRKLQSSGIGITIALNLGLTFAISNIDWRAHIGGLITGSLIGLIMVKSPIGAHRARFQWLGMAVLALLIAAGGAIAAHHVSHHCPAFEQHGASIQALCFTT